MKRYMCGGRKDGNYYPITSESVEGLLVLAEGFATAATIHECTGYPVAVCFDAPNLIPVAKALRTKYKTIHIVLAADNDVYADGNPGLTYAEKAAAHVAGQVIYPEFGDIEQKLTDWNDMAGLFECSSLSITASGIRESLRFSLSHRAVFADGSAAREIITE